MTRLPRKEEKALVCELIAQLKCKEQWRKDSEFYYDKVRIENKITKIKIRLNEYGKIRLYKPTQIMFSIWNGFKLKYHLKKVTKYLDDVEERQIQSLAIKELGHLISPPSQVVAEVEDTFINPIPDYKLGDFMKET